MCIYIYAYIYMCNGTLLWKAAISDYIYRSKRITSHKNEMHPCSRMHVGTMLADDLGMFDWRLPGSCLFHSKYTCINVYVEMYNYVQISKSIHIKCAFIYDSFFQLYMFCHILRSVKSAVGTSPSADRWMAYYISILNSNWSVCMKSVCMKPVLPQRSRGIALTEDNPLSHHIVPLHGFH